MKTIYSVSVIAAALLFFASCQKENLVSDNQQPVLRTITASFENSGTKTTLGENDIPLWGVGDVIRLLDATTHDDIILTSEMINGSSVTFTTTLTGNTLYAVYPASATAMDKCTDGSITFAIPVVQDGTFGSANICVAKGDSDDNDIVNLVFSNATAVLEFSQNNPSSTGVIRVAVEAANNIAGTLTATFGTDNKATVSASGLANKTIFTKAVASAVNKYYVAVAPGVATGEVNFKYYKALQEASDSKSSATLVRNKIYTLSIPNSGYENSYVEITADYDCDPSTDETTLKWAKVNIGAIKPEDYGHYFAWGETTGLASSDITSTNFPSSKYYSADNANTWRQSGGFCWDNCPWTNGIYVSLNKKVFTKYVPTAKETDYWKGTGSADNKTTLDLADDAANANWGGSWRMPTREEYGALSSLTREWKTNYNSTGVNGYLFTSGSQSIFLPAAGYGNGTGLDRVGGSGFYWSSSLDTDYPYGAYCLYFYDGSASTTSDYNRYYGQSVRALSE